MGEESDVGAQGKAGEEADQTAGGFTRTLSNFGPKSFPPFRPQVTLSLKQNDHYLKVICHQALSLWMMKFLCSVLFRSVPPLR